jgi:protoporphyrinogen oxidase
MLFYPLLCTLFLLASALGDGDAQIVLNSPSPEADKATGVARFAIIGAGIAGASATYHLREEYHGTWVDITVYEVGYQMGGRNRSTKVYDGAYGSQRVETGAHSFYANDGCIQYLIDETGLRQKLEPHYPRKKAVGVWDGTSFILRDEHDLKARTWGRWIRYTWRYGLSVHRVRIWMAEKFPQIQRLLGAYEIVDRNIPEVIDRLGLTAEKEKCAQSCLHNLTSSDFSREVVQVTTRAWHAQDLTAPNGLAALVAMNPAVTDSIWPASGGISKLIDRLIKLSDVDLRFDNTVTRTQRSEQRKYRLTIRADGRQDQSPSNEEADNDAIIIAAPLQSARIDFNIGIHVANALTPYASVSSPREQILDWTDVLH